MGFDKIDNETSDNILMSINDKSMVKAIKTTEGNSEVPEEKDNVFFVLYKDPNTFARKSRTIYLSRHGESHFNLYGKIGGNANLSPQGMKYSTKLAEYFHNLNLDNFHVWTSELVRTHQTAFHINSQKTVIPQLNEIDSGDFDGMTYEDVADKFPIEFALRDQDKLNYRYPAGESYVDVCRRLNEILPLMNTSENLLVVSHQAVVRCLYTYLMKTPMADLPYVKIPLHTVMKVTFDGSRNVMESTYLNIDCVDTHRAKPENCNNNRRIEDAVETVPLHM